MSEHNVRELEHVKNLRLKSLILTGFTTNQLTLQPCSGTQRRKSNSQYYAPFHYHESLSQHPSYSNVWIKSTHRAEGKIKHFSEPVVGAYSVAYGLVEHELNTITESDASHMANLWSSFSYFLDDRFEQNYRRIVRALKRFELSHAVYFADLRYPLFHSALEAMICTGHHFNKDQVTQRLPQLVPFISSQQAVEIYELFGDFKHAAEAILQDSNRKGPLSDRDQKRVDCVPLLHEGVRYLLLKVLQERSFADVLASVDALAESYPAYHNGKLIVPKARKIQ